LTYRAQITQNFLFRPLLFVALAGVSLSPIIDGEAHAQNQPATVGIGRRQNNPKTETDKNKPAKNEKKSTPQASARPTSRVKEKPVPVGAQVSEILVSGQRKIEKDAVLARLKTKAGQGYSADDVREDIQNLFKSGFFFNVEVLRTTTAKGIVLEYKVLEKPSMAEIVYEGVSELKSEDVSEAAGIKAYEILNSSKLKEAQEKVQKLYEDKGFFLAKVDVQIDDLVKDETVKVTFKIKENDKVKVKKITFLGNKKLSDNTLKSKLLTQEEGYFTGLSGSGAYKQEIFERDTQIVRFIYYNQGYIQAKVDRPQVTVTPDKKGIYITIRVEEGEQFEVGDLDFANDILFPRQELFDVIKLDDNKIFAYDLLQKDLSELQAKYGDLGYAYTNVIPRWNIREKDKKVDLVFEFDKGNKVYFNQINVVGNSKTRDKVLRRELKIKEGELYHETRRRLSLENVQRLGFFEEVNFKTSSVPDHPELMNIDIVVKERSTGQIQFGAGYGTTQGFTLQGSVQQTNFLGKGQNLGVSLNHSNNYTLYDVSFTEPYYNDTLWSVGFRVFQSSNTGRLDFNERKTGGSVFFGHPIGEYTRANLSYTYSASRLFDVKDKDDVSLTDPDLFPLHTADGDAGLVGASIDYDTRNDRLRPSKGIYARAGYSLTGPFGGNLRYYKANADFRFFKNIFWDVIFRNSLSYARIESTDPSRIPPFNELYLLGGPYTLRGYRYARVGKQLQSITIRNKLIGQGMSVEEATENSKRYYGGTQQLMYQGELLFPLINEASMYGVGFYDVGLAEDILTSDKLYSDVGFGIRWFSPIGPLRFEWGFPMNRDLNHESVVFEFSIGTPF